MDALSGGIDMMWDVPFSPRGGSQGLEPGIFVPSYLVPNSFGGSFREVVYEHDISYTPGSWSTIARPSNRGLKSATLLSVPRVLSPNVSLVVSNFNRAALKGSFRVQIHVGDAKFFIDVFQKGFGCPNCQSNKVISLDTIVPFSAIKAGANIKIKVFHRSTKALTEVTNFGNPSISFQPLIDWFIHLVDWVGNFDFALIVIMLMTEYSSVRILSICCSNRNS